MDGNPSGMAHRCQSIVGLSTFRARLALFTKGLLDDIEWSNMIVAGSSILACVKSGVDDSPKGSLFLLSLSLSLYLLFFVLFRFLFFCLFLFLSLSFSFSLQIRLCQRAWGCTIYMMLINYINKIKQAQAQAQSQTHAQAQAQAQA